MRECVERQSDQLFSSAVSRLFSSGCESEPIKELSGSSLSPASIPWTFLTPPLFTIKCFVISNLHSTGGGFLALAAERVARGQQPVIPSLFPATGRQTPTLTWEGAVSVRKKATQSSDAVLYGISTRADASEIVPISEIFFTTRLGCCSCAQHATVSAGSLPLVFHPGGSQAGWGQPHKGVTGAPMRFLHTAPGERGRSSTA